VIVRLIVQTVVWYSGIGVILFVSAGTLDWTAAWLFLVEMIVLSLVGGGWLLRYDPALMRDRLSSPIQRDQPLADKFAVAGILVACVGALVVMGLDAVRFGWSSVHPWVQVMGELILCLSIWLGFRVLAANSFAAPVVKIQKDRDHAVISSGPYAHVRHPMYSGALLFFAGMSLLLGSWWGLVPVWVLAVVLGMRIPIEEAALRAGLSGYDEYAQRVRYRLVPFVW
jgi:protein-S-isoprenylcysteine O-methyltransferase Ste14